MCMPPKLYLATEQDYRQHFYNVYCVGPIKTFDGIPVYFRRSDFDHCMYESSMRNGRKDTFSTDRSERVDWIKTTLESSSADLYQGWDCRKKCVDPDSRVAVVCNDYVVIIRISIDGFGNKRGYFRTAYLADNSIGKIRAMPKWK